MRKAYAVVAVVVLALFSTSLMGATAGASPTGSLALNAKQITDADLTRFVDLVFDRKLTVSETKAFYEGLNTEQKAKVGNLIASDLVANKLGLPLQEWRRMVEADKRQTTSNKRAAVPVAGLLNLSGNIWLQNIETGAPPSAYLPDNYWDDWYCDDDPNDRDFAYHYSFWYDQNPDGLKWDTSDTAFWLYVHAFWGGNLRGYAYTWDEALYCIGEGGAAVGGGSALLSQKLYYRY